MPHKNGLSKGVEGRSNRFQIKFIPYTKDFKIECLK